jgi:hypothetical protein
MSSLKVGDPMRMGPGGTWTDGSRPCGFVSQATFTVKENVYVGGGCYRVVVGDPRFRDGSGAKGVTGAIYVRG